MVSKTFFVVFLAVVVSQGYASLTEVTLADEYIHFISHPLYSRAITIPKSFLDTLLTCHVVYPSGIMYEAYPTNSLPHDEVEYMPAAEPFTSCAVAFRHSDRIEGFAGRYELVSLVQHRDNSMTLTNKVFHMSITVSELGMPSKE